MNLDAAMLISFLDALPPVVRATVALAASAIATLAMIRMLRIRSYRVRTAAWTLVLLQGCLFVTWTVRLLSAPRSAVTASTPLEPRFPVPAGSLESPEPASRPRPAASRSLTQPSRPKTLPESVIVSESTAPATSRERAIPWRGVLLFGWIAGIVVIALHAWGLRRRFLGAIGECERASEAWRLELLQASKALRLRRDIELLVHPNLGPCLTWKNLRNVIIVPRALWESLSPAERLLILRHELAHVRRGDLWTMLAARCIAACHWFNPFGWLACRRLEECAEWACDEAACGGNESAAVVYSRLLLHLRLTGRAPAHSAAMARPNTVATRVRRLIGEGAKESALRWLVLATVIVAGAGLMRIDVQLIAQEAAQVVPERPRKSSVSFEKLPIFGPDSPSVPGKPRPEGTLSIIGDESATVSGFTTDLVFTIDGKRLFGTSTDQTISEIDPRNLRLKECIRSYGARVLNISPSPDGRRLAAVSLDGSLRIWDISVRPAKILSELHPFAPDAKETWVNLTASKDRTRFCISDQTLVIVYEWTGNGLRAVFEQRMKTDWRPAAISPSGKKLAIREEEPEVVLWDLSVDPAVEVDRIPVEDRFVSVAGWSSEEVLILSRGNERDRFVQQVLCTETGMEYRGDKIPGFGVSPIDPLVFLDDGRRCIVNVLDVGPHIVNCSGENWVIEQHLSSPGFLHSPVVSPDGRAIYGSVNGVLRAWKREGDQFVPSFASDDQADAVKATQISFLADDKTLLASTGKAVRMFSTENPASPHEAGSIPAGLNAQITPHPTAKEAILVSLDESAVETVQCLESGLNSKARVEYGREYRDAPWCAGYSPDGQTIAVGFWDRSIEIYRNSPMALEKAADYPMAADLHICALTYSPDGRRLACGDFGHRLRLFDVAGTDLIEKMQLEPYGEAVRHALFTPDGKTLVTGAQNGEIRITDLTVSPPKERVLLYPDQPIPEKFSHDVSVISLELAARGRLLMSSSAWKGSSRLSLWSFPECELLQTWELDGWTPATVTSDGRLLAVAHGDGTICLVRPSDSVLAYLMEP